MKSRSCWNCALQQIGGETFMGRCLWYSQRKKNPDPEPREIPPHIVDVGCAHFEAVFESDSGLHGRGLRFYTLVISESNRLACTTAESIAKNPGKQYNPCWIYGAVGLGKTHLLHAIGDSIHQTHPKARILYATGEQFALECLRAMRSKKLAAFRARYTTLDCLLLDDIQFKIAAEPLGQEFLSIINGLVGSRRQIVVTSARSPKEMLPLDQRLVSRLESGFVAEIKPPSLETRIAILRKKAEFEDISISDDIILLIASSMMANASSLEGVMTCLSSFQAKTSKPMTMGDARRILREIAANNAP